MSSDAEAATMAADGDGARSPAIGLCLSGGGYRAALFHLGAVRRLNEGLNDCALNTEGGERVRMPRPA